MRIYSMTATFGKLENQTLTLQPGLNILSAPNEWGKTTWCSFLATMLYGLDTREKTTKTSLAVKERYAPWSGSPMSGRMDLEWNGRDITIERWTKGRTPMGEFRAFETESGLAIPELTGANCGELLLGVEKSVFLRAGFLRLSDLPVTSDDSLRRRLNALVTTGDESDTGDVLAQKLKDLKNKVRYNRTGLLPAAEAQRNDLQGKLTELETLQNQQQQLQQRQAALEIQRGLLENHKLALAYTAAQEKIQKVEQAHKAAKVAAENLTKAEDRCLGLPAREEAKQQLDRHALFLQHQADLVRQWNDLPPEPQQPQIPQRYRDLTPDEAICRAEEDVQTYRNLQMPQRLPNKWRWGLLCLGLVCILLGLLVQNLWYWLALVPAVMIAVSGILYSLRMRKERLRLELDELCTRYPGIPPERWVEDATLYAEQQKQYSQLLDSALLQRREIRRQMDDVEQHLKEMMGGLSSHTFLLRNNEILAAHDELAEARREHQRLSAHAAALGSMTTHVQPPPVPDDLRYSELETQQRLQDTDYEQKQLQLRLGQFQGRMEVLGTQEQLQKALDNANARLAQLNLTYQALELAQKTLTDATAQLQRRFAPRITAQAKHFFGALTDGRYDRLQLQQDLSVETAAEQDATIRPVQWRSDGTIDQLYLALRLAVAKELTPQAPLILDDALVRFDDQRHAAAMKLLQEEARQKQILLFTCQRREESYRT